jgi:hypothetical protein
MDVTARAPGPIVAEEVGARVLHGLIVEDGQERNHGQAHDGWAPLLETSESPENVLEDSDLARKGVRTR